MQSFLNRLSVNVFILAPVTVFVLAACKQSSYTVEASEIDKPNGSAVATSHPLATKAGQHVLENGGNAFDAAVAIAATLGVVEPYGSGLGGGSYWLLRKAGEKPVIVDARETAPLESTIDMNLDDDGNYDRKKATVGPLAAGIPGQPAALAYVSANFGENSLEQNLVSAIGFADKGFPVDKHYLRTFSWGTRSLKQFDASSQIFLDESRNAPEVGDTVVQKQLANTLRFLANKGHDGFYNSDFTKTLVDEVRSAGGIWSQKDFYQYELKIKQPLIGRYKNATVYSVPPSSSGGTVILQTLNILEQYDDLLSNPKTRHSIVIEAMRHAYRNRAIHLGDPDFSEIPLDILLDKNYAAHYSQSIKANTPTSHEVFKTQTPYKQQGTQTTHFSVLDKDGNLASVTMSINTWFGSGFTAPSSGILLNNEMDDFSAKVRAQNSYGLTAETLVNAIEPGKRPLSSMSPTFFETDDQLGILGTPGGSRIISMVLLGILSAMDDKPVDTWVNQPRYHHQYIPDVVQLEPSLYESPLKERLETMGYKTKTVNRQYGNMQAISWNKKTGEVTAASDNRGIGEANVFQ